MLYKVVSIPIYIERFFFEEQDPPMFNSSAILATVALTGFHLDGDSGLRSTTVRAKRRSTGPAAPHALVFDITDAFWLPLKKWSQQHRYKWKGQPLLPMLTSLCDESFQRKGGICREQIEGKMLLIHIL